MKKFLAIHFELEKHGAYDEVDEKEFDHIGDAIKESNEAMKNNVVLFAVEIYKVKDGTCVAKLERDYRIVVDSNPEGDGTYTAEGFKAWKKEDN